MHLFLFLFHLIICFTSQTKKNAFFIWLCPKGPGTQSWSLWSRQTAASWCFLCFCNAVALQPLSALLGIVDYVWSQSTLSSCVLLITASPLFRLNVNILSSHVPSQSIKCRDVTRTYSVAWWWDFHKMERKIVKAWRGMGCSKWSGLLEISLCCITKISHKQNATVELQRGEIGMTGMLMW